MQVPDLDIIAGLEEAYFKVVQFVSASAANAVQLRRSRPAKSRRYLVGNRGLPVLWHDLYNSLSSGRHIAWTSLWESLPFGSHGGANGYPGSGFSAFIYINAPRYQLGLDPLLDPPANLLINGDFNGNADNWGFGDGFYYNDHNVSSPPGDWGDSAFFFQVLDIVNGASYHVSFDVRFNPLNIDGDGDSDVTISVSAGNDSPTPHVFSNQHFADGDYHTLECDITGEWDDPDSDRVFKISLALADFLDATTLDITNVVLTFN